MNSHFESLFELLLHFSHETCKLFYWNPLIFCRRSFPEVEYRIFHLVCHSKKKTPFLKREPLNDGDKLAIFIRPQKLVSARVWAHFSLLFLVASIQKKHQSHPLEPHHSHSTRGWEMKGCKPLGDLFLAIRYMTLTPGLPSRNLTSTFFSGAS